MSSAVRFQSGVLLAVSLALIGASAMAAAQATTPSISVVPDSLVLIPGGTTTAFLVLRNPDDNALHRVRLTSLEVSGISVRFADTLFATLAAHAAVSTTMFVTRDSVGVRPASLALRLDFQRGSSRISGVLLERVELVGDPLATIDSVAKLELSATPLTVTERDPGKVDVIITNKTDLPITVRRISARGPIVATLDSSAQMSIPPFAVRSFTMDLELSGAKRILPGKRKLLFDVELGWSSSTGPRTGNSVLQHDVDLAVFGESVVLKVLSVPSFLVLPGFLMLVAFGMVWKYRDFLRGAKGSAFDLTPAKAEFWVIAITLSGVMALVSRGVYLNGYRTSDLVVVWLVSVLLGAVSGLIWVSWRYVWITPSPKDSQVTILRKLARQRMNIECELVVLDHGVKRYLVQPVPDDGSVWVAPTIAITWASSVPNEFRERYNELREQRKARPLATFLDAAMKQGAVTIAWDPAAELPSSVPVSKVTRSGSGLIVEAT